MSQKITEYVQKNSSAKTKTIYNGVGRRFFEECAQGKDLKKTNVIYIGTYTPWDGAELIPELARQFPYIQFVMVGDGQRREKIKSLAPENVMFYGFVPYDQLTEYYQKADAGIVLYEYERHQKVETSSLKTLEYIASGLPVFSTDIPGQTFIKKHQLGILCQESDVVDSFQIFLLQLELFKRNVVLYKKENQAQLSWERVAVETEMFISGFC